MASYEWKLVNQSFVLHKDGKPLQSWVSFDGWSWTVTDHGHLLEGRQFDSPKDAMTFVNLTTNIKAPFDEEEGLEKIIDELQESFDSYMNLIINQVTMAKDSLMKMENILWKYEFFDEGHWYIDDFLSETQRKAMSYGGRLDSLVSKWKMKKAEEKSE